MMLSRPTPAFAISIIVAMTLLGSGSRVLAIPAAEVSSPFFYNFDVSGTMEEAASMSMSGSPYWWLSSGGYFHLDGTGETVQGSLPPGNRWRLLYSMTSPVDTDVGYHPQNLFRLVTRSRWRTFRQQAYFRIARDNLSASPNRNASNGVFLMNRYLDQDNLYYTGVRVDGAAVIKKKRHGVYYTMAYRGGVFPGARYDRVSNPSLLPKSAWLGLTCEILDRPDGTVRLRLHVYRLEMWTLIFDVIDDGSDGAPPIAQSGYGGLRSDFMDVEFENYLAKNL